jgi:hypothetical protein
MRGRGLNPEEIGRAIVRLQAEQASDFDFPQLIPVERAAELLYGPTDWSRLLRNLRSAWTTRLIFCICQFTRWKTLARESYSLRQVASPISLEQRKQVRYVPVLRMEVRTYDLDGSLRIDLADHDPALDQHPGVSALRCFHACFSRSRILIVRITPEQRARLKRNS